MGVAKGHPLDSKYNLKDVFCIGLHLSAPCFEDSIYKFNTSVRLSRQH